MYHPQNNSSSSRKKFHNSHVTHFYCIWEIPLTQSPCQQSTEAGHKTVYKQESTILTHSRNQQSSGTQAHRTRPKRPREKILSNHERQTRGCPGSFPDLSSCVSRYVKLPKVPLAVVLPSHQLRCLSMWSSILFVSLN